MITGKDLIEKMYSENYDEYEDTRLYSTGDSDLDDLLERAFCEGYEYAQKEFAAYKSPISREQARKLVKEANDMGIKGRNVAQIGKNVLKQAMANSGADKNDWSNALSMLRDKNLKKTDTNKNSRMAQRVNKAALYALKKGLK